MFYCFSLRLPTSALAIRTTTVNERVERLVSKGYTVIALDYCIDASKIKQNPPSWPTIECDQLSCTQQPVQILKRLTIRVDSPADLPKLSDYAEIADILAIEPYSEKGLTFAIQAYREIDILSIGPYTQNFKSTFGLMKTAEQSGIVLEFHTSHLMDFEIKSRASYLAKIYQFLRTSRNRNFILSWGDDNGTDCLEPYEACSYMQQFMKVSAKRSMEALTTNGTVVMRRSKARRAKLYSYYLDDKSETEPWKIYTPFSNEGVVKKRKE